MFEKTQNKQKRGRGWPIFLTSKPVENLNEQSCRLYNPSNQVIMFLNIFVSIESRQIDRFYKIGDQCSISTIVSSAKNYLTYCTTLLLLLLGPIKIQIMQRLMNRQIIFLT